MTTLKDELRDVHPARQSLGILLAVGATVPGLVLRIADIHTEHWLDAVLFGLAIVGAAFILSWAAEAAKTRLGPGQIVTPTARSPSSCRSRLAGRPTP